MVWVKTHKHTHTVSSQLLSLFAATCVSTKCDATLNITLIFISARRDHTSVCYSPTRHYNLSRYVSKLMNLLRITCSRTLQLNSNFPYSTKLIKPASRSPKKQTRHLFQTI